LSINYTYKIKSPQGDFILYKLSDSLSSKVLVSMETVFPKKHAPFRNWYQKRRFRILFDYQAKWAHRIPTCTTLCD